MKIVEIALLNLLVFIISSSGTGVINIGKWNKGNGLSFWQVPKTICVHFLLLLVVTIVIPLNSIFNWESGIIILAIYLIITLILVGIRNFSQPVTGKAYENILDSGNGGGSSILLKENGIKEISADLFPEYTKALSAEEKQILNKLFSLESRKNFHDSSIRLPDESPKGAKMNFLPALINNIKDINTELTGIYHSLSTFGFLIINYIPLDAVNKSELTREKKLIRKISKAEVWGRLHYCGFEVLNEVIENGIAFVLAQKGDEKKEYKNPSEGTIIKLIRIGYKGNLFYAYKIRTMYPYSEYIQSKVFALNSLAGSGKIKNDFRITPAGKYLRKYWIDELPQIINWLKGDIKLVGIRGMSIHYFRLYPEYYKTAYLSVRPGLIPPIFDDTGNGFDHIVKTEYKYLTDYLKSPVKTDFKCFFETFYSIFFKGIRGH